VTRRLSIVEHPFEVGSLVPPYVHTREDAFSIVLQGSIGFRSEDQEVVLGPGGDIVKLRIWSTPCGTRARPQPA
jgi:hypothetical protein